ncbi:MAG: ExbD/TolR family protein [Acidobacteriota bacterium]
MSARAALLAVALGCSGSHAPPCTDVADHAMSLVGLFGSAADYPVDPRAPFRAIVVRRCEDDAWPAAARTCMRAAARRGDFLACRTQLTPAQASALAADVDALENAPVAVAKKPAPPAAPATTTPSVVIDVRADGTLAIAGRPVDDAALDRELGAIAAAARDTQIVVHAAPGVSHGAVVHVLERAKQAGLSRLAISTGP